MADDPGAQPGGAVQPAGRLRGDTVDVLDFADRFQRFAIPAIVERTAFHEDAGDDVVPGGDVGRELIERVVRDGNQRFEEAVPGFGKGRQHGPQVPQVMVRIDDRQIGFDDRLGHGVVSDMFDADGAGKRRGFGIAIRQG